MLPCANLQSLFILIYLWQGQDIVVSLRRVPIDNVRHTKEEMEKNLILLFAIDSLWAVC